MEGNHTHIPPTWVGFPSARPGGPVKPAIFQPTGQPDELSEDWPAEAVEHLGDASVNTNPLSVG
jgi:hypothetical protein